MNGGGRLLSSLRNSGSPDQELHICTGSRCFNLCFHILCLALPSPRTCWQRLDSSFTKGGHSRLSDSIGAWVHRAQGWGGQV